MQDLFISYAHIDNEPLPPAEKGWIDQFHDCLEPLLKMRLGGKAKIWRDDELRGNEKFTKEIEDKIRDTALLLSIISPRYFNSEWCIREVNTFYEKTGGAMGPENKSRVLKVIKEPVERELEEKLPALKGMNGYRFYRLIKGDTPVELDPKLDARPFRDSIAILVQDIKTLVKAMQNGGGGSIPPPDKDKPKVYLAECSYDRYEDREKIRGELISHGYVVLPDIQQVLPRFEEDYTKEVEHLLDECQLSVHLVGQNYGMVPDGPSQKSVVVLQNDLAIEKSKKSGMQRVIWLPEGTHSKHEQQQKFIKALQLDAEKQYGADMINGNMETLKGQILTTLKRLQLKPKGLPPPSETRRKLIYVICIEKDLESDGGVIPLLTYLTEEQGFDVELPPFAGDAGVVRTANKEFLTTCDGILLYYGEGDATWKVSMESELRKVPAYRRNNPLSDSVVYTYLAAPDSKDKATTLKISKFKRVNMIDGLAGFSEAKMEALLHAVKAG